MEARITHESANAVHPEHLRGGRTITELWAARKHSVLVEVSFGEVMLGRLRMRCCGDGGVQFHQPSRTICRRISNARRSTGFTSGHDSWPQVVEVIERIKSRTRTHGKRYGEPRHQSLVGLAGC